MSVTTRVIKDTRKLGGRVFNRRQWGNVSPVYAIRRRTRKHDPLPSDTLWQHITVTPNSAHGGGGIKKEMRLLHRIGIERFGTGVSYNFAVDMQTGAIGLGAALDAKGAHTLNDKHILNYSFDQNAVSHAIAFIGNPGDKPSLVAIKAVAKLTAALIHQGALTHGHDYNPHSMVAFKDCPTDAVREVMQQIHHLALNHYLPILRGKNNGK